MAPSTVPRARVGRDPVADCRAGCRSAEDLVPGVFRGTHGVPQERMSGGGLRADWGPE